MIFKQSYIAATIQQRTSFGSRVSTGVDVVGYLGIMFPEYKYWRDIFMDSISNIDHMIVSTSAGLGLDMHGIRSGSLSTRKMGSDEGFRSYWKQLATPIQQLFENNLKKEVAQGRDIIIMRHTN